LKLFCKTLIGTVAITMVLGGTACAQKGAASTEMSYVPSVGQPGKDVVWVPTSQALVDRMLDMAQLTPKDRLVDLGSGDGVTVITAAKRGATARGIEFNSDLVALAKRRAEAEGVSARATFEQGDIFKSDFSAATVVTLFLLPDLNIKLRPILLDMPPGTRIVSNSFTMGEWRPDQTVDVTEGCTGFCRALKWIVPAKVAGSWKLEGKTLKLAQNFQMVEGMLRNGAETQLIGDGRLNGAQIRFTIGKDQYVGRVDGDRMQGTVNGSRSWQATRSGD
jgi:hypothetical protein